MGTSPSCCGDREAHVAGKKMSDSVLDSKLNAAARSHLLNLSGGRLSRLPPRVAELTELRNLSIESNDFAELPDAVLAMRLLRSLNVAQNRLARLPDLSPLAALQTLICSKNGLASIGPLPPSLEKVDISGNRLTSLPAALLALPKLVELDASGNQIADLPRDFSQAAALRVLNLDDNAIHTVPPEVASAPVLDALSLRNNRLAALPRPLFEDSRVVVLNVAGNAITREELQRMPGFAAFAERRRLRKNKQIAGGLHPELDLCGL